MLNANILKVRHAGFDQAKKLELYIEKCDVFSIEAAGAGENEVRKAEDLYELALKGEPLKPFSDYVGLTEGGRIRAEYNATQMAYLLNHKKPIWLVERLTDEEFGSLVPLETDDGKFLSRYLYSIDDGDIEEVVANYLKHLDIGRQKADVRDKNIARNLETAEEKIKTRYHHLRDRSVIDLGICIGAEHRPEKYLRNGLPIIANPIDLRGQPESISEILEHAYSENDSLERLRYLVLAFTVDFLGEDKIQSTDILKMTERNLTQFIISRKKK